ncbi:hypothetical protein RUND412_007651 [Rhizina undulata]
MAPLTNYVAYIPRSQNTPRIGHLDLSTNLITPLSFPSGTKLTSLYQVILNPSVTFIPSSRYVEPIPIGDVTLLPPLADRDVLAIGKNYAEHAKEFNSSGYDSSDKVDQPTHPVVFTKRASSIVASGTEIYPHDGWTESLDYEGEIGVILGKEGFRVGEKEAWDYVWGFTIINDITAREKQRDHKQFFIGKSGDTFCPMGPIAVPLTSLPSSPDALTVITKVNGEVRQNSNFSQLIFSIPTLIATISAGTTIQPGDVIATGTPAGVGIGFKPPRFLSSGDEIVVEVEGLGRLVNKVGPKSSPPVKILKSEHPLSAIAPPQPTGLRKIGGKDIHIVTPPELDVEKDVVIFVHGLGGSTGFYRPLVSKFGGLNYLLYDLEGHGLSPTTPQSVVSISSYAEDLHNIITEYKFPAKNVTLVAHSMGCLIATTYTARYGPIKNLVLIGPPPIPLPATTVEGSFKRADAVREDGMAAVADAVVNAATSAQSKEKNPMGVEYVRTLLLGNDPEGYAKGCTALASFDAGELDLAKVSNNAKKILLIAGSEDKVAAVPAVEALGTKLGGHVTVLEGVGHWHVLEDLKGMAIALGQVF